MARLCDAIAAPMFSPESWQTPAPQSLFSPRGLPVQPSEDLTRILALPRRAPVDLDSVQAQAMVEHVMAKYAIDNPNCRCREIDPRRDCITRLLPVQAWALHEISVVGGVLASVQVGGGKTGIGVLAALALPDSPSTLLLIPSTLVEQICLDYQMFKQHFRVPDIIVHNDNARPWEGQLNRQSDRMLHVLPYSRLSNPKAAAWIEQLGPSAIIADECDSLKDLTRRPARCA